MITHIKENLMEAQNALANLLENEPTLGKIEQVANLMVSCFERQGHVYSCGNGGSMCDAMHFAEELSGRFRRDRPALGALAMSDGAYLSCVSNDFGYDQVFSRFLEAHGRNGDVLLAISTSGRSPNVLKAAATAKAMNIHVVGLTGRAESDLARYADIEICTPGGRFADRVQELHIKVIHILIELIERQMFPKNYEE